MEQHGMDALSEAAGSDNVDPSLLMHVMEARCVSECVCVVVCA